MVEVEKYSLTAQEAPPKERFSKIRKLARKGRERFHALTSRDNGREREQIEHIQEALHSEAKKREVHPALFPRGESSPVEHQRSSVEHQKIKDPDLPVVWPHEEERLKRKRDMGLSTLLDQVGRVYADVAKTRGSRSKLSLQVMERVNGTEAIPLARKYSFIETVRQMGYTAPEQTLIQHGQSLDEKRDVVSQHFSDPEQLLICKPVDGAGGKGIIEGKAGDMAALLPQLKKDYIIQEKVPIDGELRYVRIVNEHDGVIRRVYDEKEIPKLEGDGQKTKWQLIRGGDLPLSAKLATAVQNIRSLRTVVPEGGNMHVSRLGVPHKDKLEWDPEKRQRVENTDRFMRQFLEDLQTKVGGQLPVLCFDIGVKDMSVLDRPYDFEEMKKNLVPFECQVPFGVNGYIMRSSKSPLALARMYNQLEFSVQTGKREAFLKE